METVVDTTTTLTPSFEVVTELYPLTFTFPDGKSLCFYKPYREIADAPAPLLPRLFFTGKLARICSPWI